MRKLLNFGYHIMVVKQRVDCIPRRGALVKRNYRFLDTKRTILYPKNKLIILKVIFMILMVWKNHFSDLSNGILHTF